MNKNDKNYYLKMWLFKECWKRINTTKCPGYCDSCQYTIDLDEFEKFDDMNIV